MDSQLSPLQRDLIDGFFQREARFFLTGGAALAGFHLGHRTTEDLGRAEESVVVDLVLDESPQSERGKERRGRILLDSADEILANKLCTILARAELRDLVDVLFLERSGRRAEQALQLATRKDGGVSPAQLAWILSSVQIGDDARIPAGLSVTELRDFVKDLERRLAVLARPKEPPERRP